MQDNFKLVAPAVVPPLNERFQPAGISNRAFRSAVENSGDGVPLTFALERTDRSVSRYETEVFPAGHPQAGANLVYADRIFKFLLCQRGGWKVYVGGPKNVGIYIRAFDYHFMGRRFTKERSR